MSTLAVLAALAVGTGAAGVAAVVHPPRRRLAGRVHPYTVVARSRLGRGDALLPTGVGDDAGGTLARLFGPPMWAAARRVARLVESRDDEHLRRRLRRAGRFEVTPEEHRLRQLGGGAAGACCFGLVAASVLRTPLATVALLVVGFVFGAARVRGRIDRLTEERAAAMRRELTTVDQLLAMHVRTGAGPVQAASRVVERGRGVVVGELAEVLRVIRSGVREHDAFRRAAEVTAEPAAARTYLLFAAGAERGSDLAGALLELADDLRDARREELRRIAARRRAAMLVPTIGVLAPVMLLFIAAPLPSLVLGVR